MSTLALLVAAASLVVAAPTYTYSTSTSAPTAVSSGAAGFIFPLSNGFPTPNQQQLASIEQAAGGTLPDGSPPPNITANTVTSLQLIAFNELSEVAFFTELLANVTNGVEGYECDGDEKDFLIETLTAIQAQEQLHALNANGALKKFTGLPIVPCEYNFPVADLQSAIALAQTFTDLVLGTLGDVQTQFGTDGDVGLIRGVAAVIGQEGQQDGYFRELQSKRPSAEPFLTAAARDFAFSALVQNFVVPESCPSSNPAINLTVFDPLTVTSPPAAGDSTVSFSFYSNAGSEELEGMQLVYINGQNLPVLEPLQNVTSTNGIVTFDACFPQGTDLFFGLTLALITPMGNFTTVDEVADNTLFGPGLIEVL